MVNDVGWSNHFGYDTAAKFRDAIEIAGVTRELLLPIYFIGLLTSSFLVKKKYAMRCLSPLWDEW
jgi:hypothetical protein